MKSIKGLSHSQPKEMRLNGRIGVLECVGLKNPGSRKHFLRPQLQMADRSIPPMMIKPVEDRSGFSILQALYLLTLAIAYQKKLRQEYRI